MDIKDTPTETLTEILNTTTSEAVKSTILRELRRRAPRPPQFYPEGPFADDAPDFSG